MKLIAFFSALVLVAFIFFGCDAKTKEAGDKMAEATKELVKTAITEAADTAKAKAAEAADVAKDKAAEAAEKGQGKSQGQGRRSSRSRRRSSQKITYNGMGYAVE